MNIEDFKSEWQNTGGPVREGDQLSQMIKVKNHPTLKNLRLKLLIEAVTLTAFLSVYYDGFDGYNKPFYINALLVLSVVLYIGNNVIGYIFLKNPVKGKNISLSIRKQISGLQRLSILSQLAAIVYAITMVLFFTVSIELTMYKYMILAAMLITFGILFYLSSRNWQRKIEHFSRLSAEFGQTL